MKVIRKIILERDNDAWNFPLNKYNGLSEKNFLLIGLINKGS